MYLETRSKTITEADDTIAYHFTELIPKDSDEHTLYKDDKGNLWNLVDYDNDTKLYVMTVVDYEDGYYTDTSITWYFDQAEFDALTTVSINA